MGAKNATPLTHSQRPAGTPAAGRSAPQAAVTPSSPVVHLHRVLGNRAVGALIQRSRDGGGSSSPPGGPTGSASAGRPLESSVRRALEGGYRTDLGGVRIHTDDAAAGAAHSLGARAFATGNEIWFGRGQYRPEHPQGRYLLAHEIAHTIQQRGIARAPLEPLRVGAVNDPAEAAADRAAASVLCGEPVPTVGRSSQLIRRYAITRAEPVVENGETVVLVDLDNGVRYRVRRIQRVISELGTPSSYRPPRVTPGSDQDDVWVRVDWCTGTRGTTRVGVNIPEQLRDLVNRLLTAATSGGSLGGTVAATQLTPFVDFAVAQSGGVRVSGEVRVTVGRGGATGGGGGLHVESGPVRAGVGLETGPTGTSVMVTVTITPGARSEEFTCPRDQGRREWFRRETSYECSHEVTQRPVPEPPRSATPDPTVSLYFVYMQDTIREQASSTELERLRRLLSEGYRVSRVEGFTSPEGSTPPDPARRWEGNATLGERRAKAALARIGPLLLTPEGRGELYQLVVAGREVEGTDQARHAAGEFQKLPEEVARLTAADRARLAQARTADARAAVIYPYLRRAVITLTRAGTPPRAPTLAPDRVLPFDRYLCPDDVLDRARPLFDRGGPGTARGRRPP